MRNSAASTPNCDSNVLYYTSTSPSYPAPLTHLYHATASRNLSTSLPTTPASTTTDIDSAYCPQCLTSWDGSTAFSTAKGRCMKSFEDKLLVGCVGCPECRSTLTISVLDKDSVNVKNDGSHVCVYKCGYCHWDSTECGIFESFDINDDVATENMKMATKILQEKLTDKMQTKEETKHFEELQSSWLNKSNQLELAKRRASLFSNGNGSTIANDLDVEEKKTSGKWDVESLEEAIRQRRETLAEQVTLSVSIEGTHMHTSVLSIGDNVIVDDSGNENILNEASNEQAWQQIVSTSAAAKPPLPIPIALRARSVRRCRSEVESGRPGILVKPKVNPLEGDISLRYGHGQWWKKDSSAIHSIPRIQIKRQKYNSSTNQYALLFQVKNPTLGPIRLQIHSNFDESVAFPSSCDVVLDSMTLKKEVVNIIPPTPSVDKELFTLEASEVMRKDSNGDRNDAWSKDDLNWSTASTCKLIGVNNDVAWVQLITKGPEEKTSDGNFIGTPLLLEIEVGEDSWESSLIHAKEMIDGEKDFVPFTILPVWKKGDA